MGWNAIDQQVQALCDRLARDPATVLLEVMKLLAEERDAGCLRPSVRLRLFGIAMTAHRRIGDFELAEQAAIEGSMIAARSPIANADYLLHLATLRIVQDRPDDAIRSIDRAAKLMRRELAKPEPTAKESQRRRRWMRTAKASSSVLRGQVLVLHSKGSVDQVFTETFEALQLTSDLVKATSYTRRVHLAAVTVLCSLLVKYGTATIAGQAIEILDRAEHVLIYRCRVAPDHVHRIKLKWCRALVLARLGSLNKAERLLVEVVERLAAQGFENDTQRALDALVWVIERTTRPARAGYYELKYRG
ncbi:MAG: hypothetical protein AAF560_16655 [Acidobacteriota bacterium]